MSSEILGPVLAIVFTIIVFLICREIVCWYFKVNEITNLLGKMENSLQSAAGLLREINRSLKNGASAGQKAENQK